MVQLTVNIAGITDQQHIRRILADEQRQGKVLDRHTQHLILNFLILLALERMPAVGEVAVMGK